MKSINHLEIIKKKKKRRKKLNIFTHEQFSVEFKTPFHHIDSLRPSISYPFLSFYMAKTVHCTGEYSVIYHCWFNQGTALSNKLFA